MKLCQVNKTLKKDSNINFFSEHPKRIGYFGHKAIGNLDQIQAIQYSTGP